MTKYNSSIWLILWMFLGVAGCAQPRSEKFPDNNIVYQSSQFQSPSIGFVNADGSNNVVLPLDFYPALPMWSNDGKTLYFVTNWEATVDAFGYVSYWQEGEAVHKCTNSDWRLIVSPAADPAQAFVMKYQGALILADMEKCRVIDERLDKPPNDPYYYTPALSPDGQVIAYGISSWQGKELEFSVEVRDNATGKVTQIGSGINPALSPDNQWIAYVQFDGIYVSASDGSQQRRLVEYASRDSAISFQFEPGPPRPQWSPDGQWLVYHKCIASPGACSYASDYSVFKVNISTGEEVKIVDGGAYPYWRRR